MLHLLLEVIAHPIVALVGFAVGYLIPGSIPALLGALLKATNPLLGVALTAVKTLLNKLFSKKQ
jgi:hypothetical protein